MINILLQNKVLILTISVSILEAFLRLKPTEKNLSIIDFLHSTLNVLVPNRAIETSTGSQESKGALIGKLITKFKIKK